MGRLASILVTVALTILVPQRPSIDWSTVDQETTRHFQALLKFAQRHSVGSQGGGMV